MDEVPRGRAAFEGGAVPATMKGYSSGGELAQVLRFKLEADGTLRVGPPAAGKH